MAESKSQERVSICPRLLGELLASNDNETPMEVCPFLVEVIIGLTTGANSTLTLTLRSLSPTPPPTGLSVLSTITNSSSPSSSCGTVQVSESEPLID